MIEKRLGRIDLGGFSYVFKPTADKAVWQATKFKAGVIQGSYMVSREECECKGFRMHHKSCRHMVMLVSLLNDKSFISFELEEARAIARVVIRGLEPFMSSIQIDDYIRDSAGEITGVKIRAKTPSSGSVHLAGYKKGLRVEVEVEGKVLAHAV